VLLSALADADCWSTLISGEESFIWSGAKLPGADGEVL
jgi:hypothetical protein